jgi:hypothetical protein
MPFVRRDAEGYIDAVFEAPEGEAQEELASEDPEVLEFLGLDLGEAAKADEWLKSDLALARVIEDLINIMIDKGLIAFTDLPTGAQEKLIQRSNLRSELSYVASLFTSEEGDDYI